MLHFYKLRDDLFDPAPGREVYVKRPGGGRGWPEECPPIRAANSFGYDVLANFDVTFVKNDDGTWRAEPDVEISSDFDWSPSEDVVGRPLTQRYAWFWERGQRLPHPIDDRVFDAIKNQVKVSSFLWLSSDPNEILIVGDVPNPPDGRGFRAVSAVVETDWYPASYPWHAVLELDPSRDRIAIEKGQPICRLTPVRRDAYFAKLMTADEFDAFYQRGQKWLSTHGKPHAAAGDNGTLDLTRTYVKQQAKSRFIVL